MARPCVVTLCRPFPLHSTAVDPPRLPRIFFSFFLCHTFLPPPFTTQWHSFSAAPCAISLSVSSRCFHLSWVACVAASDAVIKSATPCQCVPSATSNTPVSSISVATSSLHTLKNLALVKRMESPQLPSHTIAILRAAEGHSTVATYSSDTSAPMAGNSNDGSPARVIPMSVLTSVTIRTGLQQRKST